jgi:hypothetical protein
MSQPRTVWEESDGVAAGGGAIVRAASFPVGDIERGAVTFTVRVPDDFFARIEGGGASATLLITPNEARGFASWLEEAAAAADRVGPPLYG